MVPVPLFGTLYSWPRGKKRVDGPVTSTTSASAKKYLDPLSQYPGTKIWQYRFWTAFGGQTDSSTGRSGASSCGHCGRDRHHAANARSQPRLDPSTSLSRTPCSQWPSAQTTGKGPDGPTAGISHRSTARSTPSMSVFMKQKSILLRVKFAWQNCPQLRGKKKKKKNR